MTSVMALSTTAVPLNLGMSARTKDQGLDRLDRQPGTSDFDQAQPSGTRSVSSSSPTGRRVCCGPCHRRGEEQVSPCSPALIDSRLRVPLLKRQTTRSRTVPVTCQVVLQLTSREGGAIRNTLCRAAPWPIWR